MTPSSTVEGTVEQTNPTGLRLNGEWFNVSKFRPVALPPPGAHVRVEIDAKGFIRDLVHVDSGSASSSVQVASAQLDERATRLAVLSAAASFLGAMSQTHQDVRSEHVLMLADKWLAWVEGN